jgi:hypothetical protein
MPVFLDQQRRGMRIMSHVDETGFRPLLQELDNWAATGRQATLWWRDDDAGAPTAALDRMIALSAANAVPLGLAVIPARATTALAARLQSAPTVFVLQHGLAHTNHAPPGERAAEFGPHRSLPARAAEIADGWHRLAGMPRRLPLFVPPWNRYAPDIAPALAASGLRAVSAFGPARQLTAGIVEGNCHCDIISWKTTRGFTGTAKSITMIADHLVARRTGAAPAAEVTGVLTHHLDHDPDCWRFLGALFQVTRVHPAARWISPADLIGGASA